MSSSAETIAMITLSDAYTWTRAVAPGVRGADLHKYLPPSIDLSDDDRSMLGATFAGTTFAGATFFGLITMSYAYTWMRAVSSSLVDPSIAICLDDDDFLQFKPKGVLVHEVPKDRCVWLQR